MLHNFDFPETRGDVEIALYEGTARIDRCDGSGWHIAGIDLYGWKKGAGDASVALAQDDPLYTRIALHLQQTKYVEISAEWAENVAKQRAEKETV
jgi:hypothetical protein